MQGLESAKVLKNIGKYIDKYLSKHIEIELHNQKKNATSSTLVENKPIAVAEEENSEKLQTSPKVKSSNAW